MDGFRCWVFLTHLPPIFIRIICNVNPVPRPEGRRGGGERREERTGERWGGERRGEERWGNERREGNERGEEEWRGR